RNVTGVQTCALPIFLDAVGRKANEIIIGLGGSATNDGGFGMARALGFRFDYEQEQKKDRDRECVTDLVNLSRIEKPQELKLPKKIGRASCRERVWLK